ncbi:MAG: hypothetical protein QOJ26_243, partial [Thermoplasmata archaeon]|nr:hypothetical protein [Thermoplasmata archaeon]
GVKVYRDGAPVVMLDDAITSYTDAGLTPGQTYTYMVTSLNGPTETQGCPTVAATAPSPPPPVPLECPYNVTATEQPDGSILMRFTPPAPVDGLRVFRAASPLRLVATLPADATSYLDTNTTPGHLYRYMVVSFRAGEQSLDCSDVEITTQAAPPPPPPPPPGGIACPTNVAAVARDDGDILLTFTPPAGVEGIRVFRTDGAIQPLATLPPDATSYLDTTTEVGQGYAYMVMAFSGDLQSTGCPAMEVTAIPDLGSPWAIGAASAGSLALMAFVRRRKA